MKFVLKPSMEHMSLVKIGISLWSQNDVRALISKLSYMRLVPSEWKKIEESVIEKVSQLSLPQPLKEKVLGVIKPIGMQIFEWMLYYRKYDAWVKLSYGIHLDLPSHLPANLCWTPQGTVDRKRTAEVLLSDENLDVSRRYRLACDFFLDDDIIRFWNRLPLGLKDYDWDYFPVVSFWSDYMKGGGASYISYKRIFYSSVRDSNKVAAKYFLQKLTPQEREECLKELAIHLEDKDTDVLCFLLPGMKEEEQIKFLKNNPYGVLQCFLQWPFQGFFVGVANCMWDFLSKCNYHEILGDIIAKVENGYKDYNYHKLFGEFWKNSPSALKGPLIEKIDKSLLLQSLFEIKDKEIIRLIFKDVSITVKEKLLYSDEIKNFCQQSIRDDEWDFLEFFIRECFPSENEMLKFKEAFETCMYFKEYCSTANKHKWNLMLCSSDDSICKYNKRSVEEGESSSSKRFQSLQ